MSEKVYPKGLRTFPPRDGAPDFVKGSLIITLNELIQFCKERGDLLTEYNGQKQLRCNMLEGEKGLYITVDTWKPTTEATTEVKEDALPF